MITKICSGGQSGVDLAALTTATSMDISTGGFAPLGWTTEDGAAPWLADYGLVECPRPGYPARTEMNVQHSDATLILTHERTLTGGTYQTMCVAESLDRPLCVVRLGVNGRPPVVMDGYKYKGYACAYPSGSVLSFKAWVGIHGVKVLNCAGPRESKCVGIFTRASEVLAELLGGLA